MSDNRLSQVPIGVDDLIRSYAFSMEYTYKVIEICQCGKNHRGDCWIVNPNDGLELIKVLKITAHHPNHRSSIMLPMEPTHKRILWNIGPVLEALKGDKPPKKPITLEYYDMVPFNMWTCKLSRKGIKLRHLANTLLLPWTERHKIYKGLITIQLDTIERTLLEVTSAYPNPYHVISIRQDLDNVVVKLRIELPALFPRGSLYWKDIDMTYNLPGKVNGMLYYIKGKEFTIKYEASMKSVDSNEIVEAHIEEDIDIDNGYYLPML